MSVVGIAIKVNKKAKEEYFIDGNPPREYNWIVALDEEEHKTMNGNDDKLHNLTSGHIFFPF